jgi:hypothetical protein
MCWVFLLIFYPRGNVFLPANVSVYDLTKPSSKKIQPATGYSGWPLERGQTMTKFSMTAAALILLSVSAHAGFKASPNYHPPALYN